MENIKYIPLGLFLAYGSKLLILGNASLVDSSLLLVLGAIAAFYEFKFQNKKIEELNSKIALCNQDLKEQAKNLEELKTHVSGLKLGQQVRLNNMR